MWSCCDDSLGVVFVSANNFASDRVKSEFNLSSVSDATASSSQGNVQYFSIGQNRFHHPSDDGISIVCIYSFLLL